MRRLSLIAPACLILSLTGILLPAPVARADEAVVVPAYSAEDMIFKPGELPDGWIVCAADVKLPEGAPTEEMLMTLGEAVGLDEDALFVESRAIHKDDSIAVIAIVDIDVAPEGYRAVLGKSATAGGWVMKDLGSPMRPMIVSAPDAETAAKLAEWQRDTAVYHLAEAGWKRIQERSMEGHEAGMALLMAARNVEPKAGVVAAVAGFLQIQQNRAGALGAWQHALAADTPVPPRGELRVQVAFQLGQALLEAGRDEVLETALAVLLDAVKTEATLEIDDHPEHAWMAFGNRYNLACAYARMGKKDEAFEALAGSFALAKKHLEGEQYKASYDHCKDVDPDMSSLREDERFEKLMEKYAPAGSSDG